MNPLHVETPLIEAQSVSERRGCRIDLKLEALQPTGSFKIRGIGLACSEYARRGARQFISSSGGNAGIAVAYAGRHLNIPVTVIVPETTSARAKELIAQQGAQLRVHGQSWQEANDLAQSLAGSGSVLLHPFDDPLLWKGHATLIDEIARSTDKPDAIVVAVGGGGLLCGVVEGLRRNDWTDVEILAVETEGAASLARSIASGRRVKLAQITTIATSLGAKQVCEQAFAYTATQRIRSVVVSDRAAVHACRRFLDEHSLLVEPACGAALAVVYDSAVELSRFRRIVVVVCGGATMTREQLDIWYAQC